jgi:hypothetical protein
MSLNRIDLELGKLASAYNCPPPTPREEMWEAIAAARSPRPARRWGWPPAGVGMAATFLIGMLIGGGLPGGTDQGVVAVPGDATALALVDPETARHLARVDLLLRAIRDDAGQNVLASDVTESARRLLAETRFLVDLPPQDQLPEVTELLHDIELVLAQIAVLDGEADRDELRLVEEGIDAREVLPRLHHFALTL